MEEFKFKNNEPVTFNNGVVSGHGVVVGVANMGQPLIGRTYIVEVFESTIEFPNQAYPYSVIPVAECHIQSIKN